KLATDLHFSAQGYAYSGHDRIQQQQAEVNEVVGIMKDNVARVLERDQRLSDLDHRAGEHRNICYAKYFWRNMKMWGIIAGVVIVLIIVVISCSARIEGWVRRDKESLRRTPSARFSWTLEGFLSFGCASKSPSYMDIVPEVFKKEIESLDKSILALHQLKTLPNSEKIELIRQLRAKNASILDYFISCRKDRAASRRSRKFEPANETPLYLQKRCNSHSRCFKIREEYLHEKEKRDLEELEELSKGRQFKYRPPPSHIYLRLCSKKADKEQNGTSKVKEKLTTAEESRIEVD
ncbi:unnamed protein product, partial [Taenia asiatica]|uniref:V-SNARE coiled-coil homology domain-containing protein n=1 Tax=Taenia asiatica TaxID=60517 RepID=A0A0R3W6H5_TAEAS